MYTTLEIHEWMQEWAAFAYFKWAFNRWSIQFYHRNGLFQFKIDLPFVKFGNTMLRKQAFDGHGGFKDIPVTSGYVFWWKIKI